jgi:hypothetical protein
MRTTILLALLLALAAPASAQTLVAAFPSLPGNAFANPVDIQAPDDGSNRLFVVEQSGYIRVFQNDPAATSVSLFLDIDARVTSGSETGLLGLAFDPDYAGNGYFYVNYTAASPLRTVISRFNVSAGDPNQADPNSEVILLTVNQPFSNHNAGQLQFGPEEGPGGERYLYVGFGDGGSAGDPFEHGQDPNTLLGEMLRLDVNGGGLPLDCGAGSGAATIPPDNPFVGQPGFCDEIYARGFRNPWRYSFDADDRLWVADVGQTTREEVTLVEAGQNHGWNEWEGSFCYDGPCSNTGFTFPIHEYGHTFSPEGGFAIIGGYVFDGPNCAAFLGRYLYGDNVTGNVWSLGYDGTTVDNDLVVGLSGRSISTFGLDEQGDLYLADLTTDDLFRFSCEQPVTVEASPVDPPVVIGPGGGSFAVDVTFTNTTSRPQTGQAWADADLSNGSEVAPVVGPRVLTIPAGGSITRRVEVSVPAIAPAGTSTLTVIVGGFPDIPLSADRFTILKQAPAGVAARSTAAGAPASWSATWEPERAGAPPAAAEAGPVAPAAGLAAHPNPFTDGTTVRFDLPDDAHARVEVLDVLGRRVALLADEVFEAGRHAVSWSGSGVPGGVYVVRLTSGSAVTAVRVTRR